MSFGLTNTPSTFMRLMNRDLCAFIGKFVAVYFDDILIYSRDLDEHLEHLKCVLVMLRKEQLYANFKKCMFCMDIVVFLEFVVSANWVEVDEKKVRTIKDWPTPKTIFEVRSFHSLASFYKRFARDFSTITTQLTEIVKKSVSFHWAEAQKHTFNTIKENLCKAPILIFHNSDKTFDIECDASGIGVGAVLHRNGGLLLTLVRS